MKNRLLYQWFTIKKSILLTFVALIIAGIYLIYQNLFYWSGWYGKPESFEQLTEKWAQLDNIPGVIVHITKAGKPLFVGSAGHLSLHAYRVLHPSTYFHTASTGKIFTTITILKLHEKGLLSLDDPIAAYINKDIVSGLVVVDGKDYGSEITFRHLLTHRSGLPNSDNSISFQFYVLSQLERERTPAELIAFARDMPAVGKPDETTFYSSIGYMLAGLAIEGVTGQPYHKIVRGEVLEPLNMTSTFESNNEMPHGIEIAHHYFGGIDLANADPSFEFADGGFITTTEDMAKLGSALIEGRVFANQATEAIFMTPLADGAGFGFFWERAQNGADYFYQPGFWGVRFVVFPEQNVVISYTLNQSNTSTQKFLKQVTQLLVDQGHI